MKRCGVNIDHMDTRALCQTAFSGLGWVDAPFYRYCVHVHPQLPTLRTYGTIKYQGCSHLVTLLVGFYESLFLCLILFLLFIDWDSFLCIFLTDWNAAVYLLTLNAPASHSRTVHIESICRKYLCRLNTNKCGVIPQVQVEDLYGAL